MTGSDRNKPVLYRPAMTGLDWFFVVFTGSGPVFWGFGNSYDQTGLGPSKKWPENRTRLDLGALQKTAPMINGFVWSIIL